ncbi:hypothetical protein CC85DRAFT_328672 [Cutaneotrichosporon oleaginosum]|uniref:Amino acid transporter n=1 Tax=Cutaneotrichosporon oleaginosum TaxID=879819 RepID=A0A0J0XL60_9TREE|nr:uncharacterized protein CC85DRAFT_328672 [Cutaneotrichosporon oleaginosum]KLT41810.1 hypothetical protein CC85DRAFT_328672 [Cutaneotrichosporon oleaginosum]TXT14733.1 hypothetical protein COLE_00926 [Cutaneotrichosporon oleaginosum]
MSMRLIPQQHSYAFFSTMLANSNADNSGSATSAGGKLGVNGIKVHEGDGYATQPSVDELRPNEHLSDEERLRMLGYDVTLGRPLGFWSSCGMNICHLSFIYESVKFVSLYAHEGPPVFIIGFPLVACLYLCLIGVFAELVSSFPVAGGMATWAWQCARHGLGGERYWGWLIVSYLFGVTSSLTIIYYSADPKTPKTEVDGIGYVPTDPKDWWEPVFYIAIICLVALLWVIRATRKSSFWVFAGAFNIAMMVVVYALIIACGAKLRSSPSAKADIRRLNRGFPRKAMLPFSMTRMTFMALPLAVMAVDTPAHMAEETRDPSRTVPRVLWYTCLFHYINIYLIVTLYIVVVTPWAQGDYMLSPLVPMGAILGSEQGIGGALGIISSLLAITQVLASVVATSRFIFALARDRAIPLSRLLVKTDKRKEPWVAMVALVASLLLSTMCWLVNKTHYNGLLQTFNYYFVNFLYIIPLILYVLSRLDLSLIGRETFSLGRLSRPCAWITILWLALGTVQGSMPGTVSNGSAEFFDGDASKAVLSYLPMVFGGMLVVMLATWFLYGRRHYVGPIRTLTLWTTGQDIDLRTIDGSNRHDDALQQIAARKTGRGSTSGSGNNDHDGPRADSHNQFHQSNAGTPRESAHAD